MLASFSFGCGRFSQKAFLLGRALGRQGKAKWTSLLNGRVSALISALGQPSRRRGDLRAPQTAIVIENNCYRPFFFLRTLETIQCSASQSLVPYQWQQHHPQLHRNADSQALPQTYSVRNGRRSTACIPNSHPGSRGLQWGCMLESLEWFLKTLVPGSHSRGS